MPITPGLVSALSKLEVFMSVYATNQTIAPAVGRRSLTAIGGVLRNWLTSVAQQWQRRRMIAALQSLNDRMLNDIGIHRSDIPDVVAAFSARELRMNPVAVSAHADNDERDFFMSEA
jgi:uncharacterized protein YjiS (DUF1127 family)